MSRHCIRGALGRARLTAVTGWAPSGHKRVMRCLALPAVLAMTAPAHAAIYGPPDEPPPVLVERSSSPAKPFAKCIKQWRGIYALSHVADVISTHAAIQRGAVEKNPLPRAIIGERPGLLEMAAYKLVTAGAFDLLAREFARSGNREAACRTYQTLAVLHFGVAAANLRFVF